MNYLDLNKLKDYKRLEILNDITYDWKRPHLLTVHNPETNEWIEEEIDISDIPLLLFLIAFVNANSSGLDLYIPLDISIKKFAEYCFDTKLESIKFRLRYIDLDYLNETGKIKSAKSYNTFKARDGVIWCHEDGASCTIQGIVFACRDIMKRYLS